MDQKRQWGSIWIASGKKGETTTLWSQSSDQSIMMSPSGTKFSGDTSGKKSIVLRHRM